MKNKNEGVEGIYFKNKFAWSEGLQCKRTFQNRFNLMGWNKKFTKWRLKIRRPYFLHFMSSKFYWLILSNEKELNFFMLWFQKPAFYHWVVNIWSAQYYGLYLHTWKYHSCSYRRTNFKLLAYKSVQSRMPLASATLMTIYIY